MPSHVALLTGINVGGHNRVAMTDLRGAVASLGHAEVQTYIQSGNVVFTAAAGGGDTITMAEALEKVIAERLGVSARVVVLSGADLDRVVANNPFPDETNPKALHAVLFREGPAEERVAAAEAAVIKVRDKGSGDDARFVGQALYVRTPDGYGRSLLVAELGRGGVRRAPMTSGTARNWATITKLVEMMEAPGG